MAASNLRVCTKCGGSIRPAASAQFVDGGVDHVICPPKPLPATAPTCVICREAILPTQNRTMAQGQDYHSHCYDRASLKRPKK
jgi:hypothetical protein